MKWTYVLRLALFIIFTSCAKVEFDKPDLASVKQSNEYFHLEQGSKEDSLWWESFANGELRDLIQSAYAESPNFLEALKRFERVGYSRQISRSATKPKLNGLGESQATNLLDGQTKNSESYTVGAALSYELDLWGRLRAQVEIDELNFQAESEEVNFLKVSLESEIALSWLDILEARERLGLLTKQLAIQVNNLELIELRYAQGLATSLDLNDQRGNVLALQARFAEVRGQEELGLNDLALLLGKSRKDFRDIETKKIPLGEQLPKLKSFDELMLNRPDLRAAQKRLEALVGKVFIAERAWYPKIDFSLRVTTESKHMHDLFDDWFGSLVSSVSAPLYDGGLRDAELAQAKLRVEEELQVYRKMVLSALKEIEDALISRKLVRDQQSLKQREFEVSQTSVDLARRRFVNGEDDYLTVIINENRMNNIELDKLNLKAAQKRYELNLFRATGGSLAKNQGKDNE